MKFDKKFLSRTLSSFVAMFFTLGALLIVQVVFSNAKGELTLKQINVVFSMVVIVLVGGMALLFLFSNVLANMK